MGTPWRLVCALSTLACACAGGMALAPRKDDGCAITGNAHGHAIQVYLEADRTGRLTPLCVGHDLTSADALWVTVEIATDAYVRTVFVTPDGQTGELLRQHADDRTRSARFQAPRGLMTRSPGEAEFVVVASRDPLHDADPTMASMLNVIRETGVLVDHEGNLTPPMREADDHTEDQLLNLGSDSLYADFDEHGVAVLTLTLQASP